MERGGNPLTDDEEINTMFGSIEERCSNTSSYGVQVEYSCSNFQPYESKKGSVNDSPKIYEINGQHAITVRASITYTMILDVDPDPELDEELRKELQEPTFTTRILTVTNIYDGYDVWQIESISKDYVFGDHYSSILETIQSFRILYPHEDTKRLESESFKLEIRENDDLVPKDVDFIFATVVCDGSQLWVLFFTAVGFTTVGVIFRCCCGCDFSLLWVLFSQRWCCFS